MQEFKSPWEDLSQRTVDLVQSGETDFIKLNEVLRETWAKMNSTSLNSSSRSSSGDGDVIGLKKSKILILVLSGALSPVHRGHIDMLLQAGLAMEADPSTNAVFAGGILSPSSDDYVRGKLGVDAALDGSFRNLLAAQAAAPYHNICVAPYDMASGNGVCAKLLTGLKKYNNLHHEENISTPNNNLHHSSSCGESICTRHKVAEGSTKKDAGVKGLEEDNEAGSLPTTPSSEVNVEDVGKPQGESLLPADFPWDQLRVVAVYGSDFYVKYPHIAASPRVIVTRVDSEGSGEKARQIFKAQRNGGYAVPGRPLHPDFLLLEPMGPIPDFSSSEVRVALQALSTTEAPAEEHAAKKAAAKVYLETALNPVVLRSMVAAIPADYHGKGGDMSLQKARSL